MIPRREMEQIEAKYATDWANALLSFATTHMTAVLAACAGYRASCLEEGFSDVAAEAMVTQYHWYLMRRLDGGRGGEG